MKGISELVSYEMHYLHLLGDSISQALAEKVC